MQPSQIFRNAPRPLVVEVDGGLLTRDPVRAGLRQILVHRPGAVLRARATMPERRGFAMQALLADPAAKLPRFAVRPVALDAICLWRRFGAPVVLISSLPEAMLAVLRDTLCPDARIFGARPNRPLAPPARKATLLAGIYGKGGFDLLARARGAEDLAPLAHRAMLIGLTPRGKRRLITAGVQPTGLPGGAQPVRYVRLRCGDGWAEDWRRGAAASPADGASVRPETHPPSRDASVAAHSRKDRAGRS